MDFGPTLLPGVNRVYHPAWRLTLGIEDNDSVTLNIVAAYDFNAGGSSSAAADVVEGALSDALATLGSADGITSVQLVRVEEATTVVT